MVAAIFEIWGPVSRAPGRISKDKLFLSHLQIEAYRYTHQWLKAVERRREEFSELENPNSIKHIVLDFKRISKLNKINVAHG